MKEPNKDQFNIESTYYRKLKRRSDAWEEVAPIVDSIKKNVEEVHRRIRSLGNKHALRKNG